MGKKLSELVNWLKGEASSQKFLNRFDRGLTVLPQFRRAVRVEKIVPLPSTEAPAGWYGGKPNMPLDVAWPSHNGEPMIFLAQFDCTHFPKSLWGGVGPREGWLLFFLPLSFEGPNDTLTCKVLHLESTGGERSVELSDEEFQRVPWIRSHFKEFMTAKTTTPFPKWPVRFLDIAETEDGSNDHAHLNPTVEEAPEFTVRERLYPASWELFYELLETLTQTFEKECSSFKYFWRKFYSDNKTYQAKAPEDRTYWDERHHEIGQKAFKDLRRACTRMPAEKAQFRQISDEFTKAGKSGMVALSDWERFVNLTANLKSTNVRWKETRRQYSRVKRIKFKYSNVFESKPETYRDYWSQLTEIILSTSRIVRGTNGPRRTVSLDNHIAFFGKRLRDQAFDPETADPDVAKHEIARRLIEMDNLAELEKAKAFLPDNYDRAFSLREAIDGQKYDTPITDEAWDTIRPLLKGLVLAKEESNWELEHIHALNEPDFNSDPLFDEKDSRIRKWILKNNLKLLEQYSRDPDSIPDGPRQCLEHRCRADAAITHDGLGGVPRWNYSEFTLFARDLYYRPEDRGPSYFDCYGLDAVPPYDKDNAVLLQLHTSDLPPWGFNNGVGSILLVIPRAHLARGDFSEIKVTLPE